MLLTREAKRKLSDLGNNKMNVANALKLSKRAKRPLNNTNSNTSSSFNNKSPAVQRAKGQKKKRIFVPAPPPPKKQKTSEFNSDSVHDYIMKHIHTSSTRQDKIIWHFILKTLKNLIQADTVLFLKSNKIHVIKAIFTGISRNVTCATNAEISCNFNNDDVIFHYFILWLDGVHDDYTPWNTSFLTFINSGYINDIYIISKSVKDHINEKIKKGDIPQKIKTILELYKTSGIIYDYEKKDIKLGGGISTKTKLACAPSSWERPVKNNIKTIFGTSETSIDKGYYPVKNNEEIFITIDQESKRVELSEQLFAGENIYSAITIEQSVDPGYELTKKGYATFMEKVAGFINKNSESFNPEAHLFFTLPRMYYKWNNVDLYDVGLTINNVINYTDPEFKYILHAGSKTYDIPTGISKDKAKKGFAELKFGKFLGDSCQLFPVIYDYNNRWDRRKNLAFGTGDGLCGFQAVFMSQVCKVKPVILIGLSTTCQSAVSISAFNITSQTSHVKKKWNLETRIKNLKSILKKQPNTTNNTRVTTFLSKLTNNNKSVFKNIFNTEKKCGPVQNIRRQLTKNINRATTNANYNKIVANMKTAWTPRAKELTLLACQQFKKIANTTATSVLNKNNRKMAKLLSTRIASKQPTSIRNPLGVLISKKPRTIFYNARNRFN